MWSRSELKTRAKEILKVNYWKAVLVSLIFSFVNGQGSGSSTSYSSHYSSDENPTSNFLALSSAEWQQLLAILTIVLVVVGITLIIGLALSIFVFHPLQVGCQRFFILCGREAASLSDMAFAFSNSYMNIVKVMFFRSLYTFLWSLLLIIPGIVKAYEYRMIPYLLAEHPDMDMKEAFAATKQMMNGDKANAWVLDLSFIGWNILGSLTCCILTIFYVAPYQNLTNTQLYETLKLKLTPSAPESMENPYLSSTNNDQNPYL
jgi:uncharacterized membrane protein